MSLHLLTYVTLMECKCGMHKFPCEASIDADLHEYRQKVYLGVGPSLHVKVYLQKRKGRRGACWLSIIHRPRTYMSVPVPLSPWILIHY